MRRIISGIAAKQVFNKIKILINKVIYGILQINIVSYIED